MPAGQFLLRTRDTSKSDELTGDLDIRADMTINGAGAAKTSIDAQGSQDRVIEVWSAASGQPLPAVLIRGVLIAGGSQGYADGGGIFNKGDLHLIGADVRNNVLDATSAPGGIVVGAGGIANSGRLQIDGGVIGANRGGNAIGGGGGPTAGAIGVSSRAMLVLNNVIVRGNSASGGTGGVNNSGGDVQVNSSSIVANVGGVGAFTNQAASGMPLSSSSLTVENSTITGNSGSFDISALGVTTLANNTIVSNSIALVAFEPVNIRATILSSTDPTKTCFSSAKVVSLGYNLDIGTSCGFAGTGDRSNVNPMLAVLADNGGGTLTHALTPGSPAIDAIPTAECILDHDQRGMNRPSPSGGACDIGAFEVQSTSGLQFHPLAYPIRLLDTRAGHKALATPGTPLVANVPIALPGDFADGSFVVPPTAAALVGNVTVDNTIGAAAGFATIYPGDTPLPLASNLNFVPGTIRPNAFTVAVGSDRRIQLLSNTGGDFIVDITGYYAPPSTGGLFFHPLAKPVRLLDTRPGQTAISMPGTPLTAGQTLVLSGRFSSGGLTVPSSASAIVGNATVDNTVGAPAGFATIYPGGVTLPPTSSLNYAPGTLAPNAFTVGLGADGTFNLFSNTGGHFVIDITGYYDNVGFGGSVFYPLAQPVRQLDTRAGHAAFVTPGAPLAADSTLALPGAFAFARSAVPTTARSLVGNATVDNTIGAPAGFATIYPGGLTLPLASNLNYAPGQTAPNAFVVGIGAGGYNLYSQSGGDFIIDISGYFASGAGTS